MVQLYVGGLSRATTESQLAQLFTPYGMVNSIRILRDWFTGRPLGFGFVEMSPPAAAEAAIAALDGFRMEGRPLNVRRQEAQISGRNRARTAYSSAAT
jgi:RNA recognition motif-containing protein